MTFPETGLHRIRLWTRERVPEHLWDQLKVEADVAFQARRHRRGQAAVGRRQRISEVLNRQSSDGPSSIHGQSLSDHVRGIVRGEEEQSAVELIWRAVSADRGISFDE